MEQTYYKTKRKISHHGEEIKDENVHRFALRVRGHDQNMYKRSIYFKVLFWKPPYI